MKKILLIVFVLTFVVSFTSCRDKREQDRAKYQVEKVKKDINDAADKISDKAEDSADAVKDAWKDTKKDVKQGAEKAQKEIKKGYNEIKKEASKKTWLIFVIYYFASSKPYM